MTSSSKFFEENSNLSMEPKELGKIIAFRINAICLSFFCFKIIGFQNFCFSIVFILWLALVANQRTKSIKKNHKLFRLIAPKPVSGKNKKCFESGAFSDQILTESIRLQFRGFIAAIFIYMYHSFNSMVKRQ